jgi:hypothetical protein
MAEGHNNVFSDDVNVLCILDRIERDDAGNWANVHVLRGAIPSDEGRDVTTHIFVPSIRRCRAVRFRDASHGGVVEYLGMESEVANDESPAYARFDCTLQDILGMRDKYCFLTVPRSTLTNGRFFGML